MRVRDKQASLLIPKSRKCHTDGFLALESCRNYTPVKFWVQPGHRRNSYLGKCLCTQYVTALDSRENLLEALGFLGNELVRALRCLA